MKSIKELITEVVDYLKENADACLDTCGADDEINYLPAKEALEKAETVLRMLR